MTKPNSSSSRNKRIESLLSSFDIPIYVGAPALLEQLTGFNLHRGALAST